MTRWMWHHPGTQTLPPSQVITSIALFMTLLVMTPVWKQVYDESIQPYTARQITLEGGDGPVDDGDAEV